jgi:hypothetical protein
LSGGQVSVLATSLEASAVDGHTDAELVRQLDMADVEFGHHGAHCTFEAFIDRFGVGDPAALSLSRVVHDLDLKEARFGMPEGPAIARLIHGLRASFLDDDRLLEQGIVVMEALYRSFAADAKAVRRKPR